MLLLGGTFNSFDSPLLLPSSSILLLRFGFLQFHLLGVLLLDALMLLCALIFLILLVFPRTSLRPNVDVVLADDQLRFFSHGFGFAARDRVVGVLGVLWAMLGGPLVRL